MRSRILLSLLLFACQGWGQMIATGLRFNPITPCRVLDTRGNGFAGLFGQPSLVAGTIRTLPITNAGCPVSSLARAYALNVTLVPIAGGPVTAVTLWPSGYPRPTVNTVVEPRGRIVATNALIASGPTGAIDVYSTNATDLVIDVGGYFTEGPSGLEYYPITPCRIVETRPSEAPADIGTLFGPPVMTAGSTRSFPLPQGRCGLPATALAYHVNFTVVPSGPLGYITAYPSGQPRPFTSILNSIDGRVLANGAIVAAGTNSGIDVFATNETHLIVDVAGYFAAANGTGTVFNTVIPCRVSALTLQTYPQALPVAGYCGTSGSSVAAAMNVTATMNQPVGYISVWPAGLPWPYTSLMNAIDAVPGSAVGNGVIVQTGSGGQINIVTTNPAAATLDVTGFFSQGSSGGGSGGASGCDLRTCGI